LPLVLRILSHCLPYIHLCPPLDYRHTPNTDSCITLHQADSTSRCTCPQDPTNKHKQIQDPLDERLSGPVPDMFRDPASVPKSLQSEGFIAAGPLGQPEASPLDLAEDFLKTNSFAKKLDRPNPPIIFGLALHRPDLLPFGMGKSLGDAKSVCDVLTVY
jgi:hypothetical protein